MRASRRHFLASAGAATLATPLPAPAAESTRPLRVAFFTDLHTRVEWGTPEALGRAADAINAASPDLAICGGDCITDGFTAAATALAPRWDAYLENLHRRLRMPVEVAIGNHDLTGVRPADGSAPDPDPRAEFLRRLGLERTWRHADHHGVRFVFLDALEILPEGEPYRGWVSDEQLEWLDGLLSASPADQPFVVVSHMPLLSVFQQAVKGALEPLAPGRAVGNNLEVLRRFEGRRLLAVLQGHLHVNELIQWRGVTFITGGAVSGKWWRGAWQGTEEGFGLVTIDPASGRVDWEYRDLFWAARRPEGQ